VKYGYINYININHLEKLSWLHGIYGFIFQHGARKVDPSDPSWISPADFVELGSSVGAGEMGGHPGESVLIC
jgi:hypothetical protein